MAAEKIGLEATLDMSSWNKGITSYLGGIDKMNSETGKTAGAFGKAFDSMGKSVLNATGLMGKALVGAAAQAAQGIAAFAVSGIKGAAELEAQLSTVAAVLGKTTAETVPLKEAVYALALNPNLKVSVDEAAAAMEMLARNGLNMEQILGGAAEATVLLANATKADFSTAADIATDAMAVFNIEAEDMMDAVDGIVSVTNNSKFSIVDYGYALSQGGAVAKAAGVEFNDFNTTLVATASNFGKGGDAGTAFKTFMTTLVPKSKEAGAAMGDLGLISANTDVALQYLAENGVQPVGDSMWDLFNQTVETYYAVNDLEMGSEEAAKQFDKWANKTGLVQSAFYNANGSLKDMSEISVLLHDKLGNLSEMERTTALNTIFGSDAARTAIGLMDAGVVIYTDAATAVAELGVSQEAVNAVMEGGITQYEALQLQMSKTDALQNAKTNTDNFKAAMDMLLDSIDAIGRQVGDLFLPYLKNIALALANVAGNAAPAIIAAFKNIIEVVAALGNYFAQVVTDGDLLNDWLTHLPVAMQPVAQSIGALISTMIAFAQYIAQVVTDGDLLNDWLTHMPAVMQPATQWIGSLILNMIALAQYIGQVVTDGDLLNDWLTHMPASMQLVAQAIGTVIVAIQSFFTNSNMLSDALRFVNENAAAFQGALAGIAALLGSAGIAAALYGIAAAIAAINLPLVALIAAAAALGAAWNTDFLGIQTTTLAVVGTLTTAFQPLLDAITSFGGSALQEMINFATGTETQFTALGAVWDAAKVTVSNLFGGIVASAVSMLPTWVAILQGWGAAATAWITAAIPTATAAIGEYASGLIATLTASDWAGTGTSIMTTLSAGLTSAQAILSTAVFAAANSIAIVFNAIDWQALGYAILGYITAGFELQYGLLLTGLAQLMISIMAVFNAADWQAVGTNILTLLSTGVEAAKGLLLTAFANIMITIRGIWDSIDWSALGTNILALLTAGVESAKGALLTLFANLLVTIQGIWDSIDWTTLGTNLLTKIRDGVESARGALVTLFATLLVTIQGIWNSIDWTALGNTLLTKIRAGVDAARGALLTLFSSILVTVQGIWNSIDWTALGTSLLTKIRDGVDAARGALVTLFANILVTIQGIWNSIDWAALGSKLLALLQSGVEAAKAALLTTFTTLTTSITNTFNSIDWAQVGIDILTGIGVGIGAVAGVLLLIVGGLVTSVIKLWEIDWATTGQAIIDGIKAGVETAKELFLTLVGGIATSTGEKWTAIDWMAVGTAILNGIKAGVDAVSAGFLAGFNTVAQDSLGKFEDIEWTVLGANIINWIKSGVIIAAGALLTLVKTTAQDAWDRFTSIDFVGAGKAIIDGVIKGITDTAGDLYQKMKDVAEDAWNEFNESIWSQSPSKLFAISGRNIVDGIIVGIEQRRGALSKTMQSLSKTLSDSFDGSWTVRAWASGDLSNQMSQLSKFSSVLKDLVGLGGTSGALASDWIAKQLSSLDARSRILEMAQSLGINPADLGDLTFDSIDKLAENLSHSVGATVMSATSKLYSAQRQAVREFTLKPLTDKLEQQSKNLAYYIGQTMNTFFQAASDQLQKKITTIDKQIETARQRYVSWNSPHDYEEINRLLAERAKIIGEIGGVYVSSARGLSQGDAYTEDLLKRQLEVIQEARKYGVYVDNLKPITNASGTQDLMLIGYAEQLVAAKRLEAAQKDVAKALYLNNLNTSFSLNTDEAQTYKTKVLDPILDQLNRWVLNDTERARLMAQYREESNKLLALDQRQLAFEQEITRLRTLQSELAGVQSAFGKRYADQVLAPILAQLENANLMESQRAGLIAQYRKESEKVLALQKQEQQLDFLNQQLALLKQVKDNELDASTIFAGMTLGVNASVADLLTATQRAVQGMIGKVQTELQIKSPSRVFMEIGRQTIDGLRVGVQKAMQQPLMATSVPRANVSTRTLNFSMSNQIYSSLDEVMLESRMQRIIERSLS